MSVVAGKGGAPAVPSKSAKVPLLSLTPRYQEEHHGTYLNRLEEAVQDPKNVNIALTGRYGAGKSSVLDEFEQNHRAKTLRLAISTLAPGLDAATTAVRDEKDTTTNRIEKEIVKQLLYSASKKVGRNSRFSQIAVLTKRRALVESSVVVAVVGLLLRLLGWLPEVEWTGKDEPTLVRMAAWSAFASLVVASWRC